MPSTHRTHLKHDVAVLGVFHALYVKATSEVIVYNLLISYPSAVLQQHIEEIIIIFAPHVYLLYQKAEHFVVPGPADGTYRHPQDLDVYVHDEAVAISREAHSGKRLL